MITIDTFLEKVKDADDIPIIKKAYDYAEKVYNDEKRKNGDLCITHALEVAKILLSLNVDTITIVSSILHEMVSYNVSKEEIEDLFGSEVYLIIDSVGKINQLELTDEKEDSAIYLRKVMVGLSEDVRVLFIKLADRLHNMRTMDVFDEKHQKKVANETLSVLVPIAHRLGINSIKSELENLCLYYLKPDVYNDILDKLNESVSELNEHLQKMKDSITNILSDNDFNFEIKGRVKSVYSIYNKLSSGKKWEDIYDILALRVFVDKESDCYAAMGIIHSKYRPVPHRFKDYIAVPKENMYQSLHTTVYGEGGRCYEIQIRTYEMDEIAEKGIASHWSYKEKGTKRVQNLMEQKLEMYRSIIENTDAIEDNEFALMVDRDILSDMIYVFTPKGDVVELPKGSTPIDFAYRIHTKVGDTMIGAIVNDVMVQITSELKENDVIKIMTNPNGKPNKDWLNYVVTSQAKNKIKTYFSKTLKDEYITKGKNMLEKELRKRKYNFQEVLSNDNIVKVCKGLKLKDLDDIYVSVGSFRYTAGFIINYIIGDDTLDTLVVKRRVVSRANRELDILVDGKKGVLTHLAKCCNPVNGDPIVGVITKSDGIAIHKSTCPNITEIKDRQVEVSWIKNAQSKYNTSIIIVTSEDVNVLPDIISVIANENLNITNIDNKDNKIYKVTFKVNNLSEIEKVIKNMSHLRFVKEVSRI